MKIYTDYCNNRINGVSRNNDNKKIYMNSVNLDNYWNNLTIYRDAYGEKIKVGDIEW